MNIKALIVDDEDQSRNVLIKLLAFVAPEIQIAGEASSCQEAYSLILEQGPDIVFLDIMLRGETGFELLQRFDKIPFEFIFTTAYDHYAIKAFRFNALDYLLKPIDKEELEIAVNKAIGRIQRFYPKLPEQMSNFYQAIEQQPKLMNKIAVPTNEGFVIVELQDIIFCQSTGSYTTFYLTGKRKITSSYTLKLYDELLTDQHFFRVHKSFLINLLHLKMYRKGEGGTAIMTEDHEVEVSRRNKEDFIKIFKNRK